MLDIHTNGTIFERLHADTSGSLELRKPRKRIIRQTHEVLTNVRPGHLADPELFDFAEPNADAMSRHNDPENP